MPDCAENNCRKEAGFVHLHVHSEYSLLDGCARIPDLIETAAQSGHTALALTDHGAVYGLVPFYKRALAKDMKAIFGTELYIRNRNGQPYHLPILAENAEGYRNLLQLSTKAHLDGFHGKPCVEIDWLAEHSKGLIALSGCLKGEIASRILVGDAAGARRNLECYLDIFGREGFYLELQRHGLVEEERVNKALVTMAGETGVGVVATNDVHYVAREDWRVHDVLLAVQTLSTLTQKNRLRLSSSEYYLKSPQEMERLFADLPEALRNTVAIAERCDVRLDLENLHIPVYIPAGGRKIGDTFAHLRELCLSGAASRFGAHIPSSVSARLEHELKIIGEMGFAGYFLIVHDIVSYAKRNGIPVGPGRGSGVGSMVSYLLDISTVNPLDHGLIFERFLNPERISMPDLDIDLCHEGRYQVLDYIRKRWGREHVAHLGAFTTLRPRAAVRDVGRALGVNQKLIDRLAGAIPAYSRDINQVLKESPRLQTMLREESQAGEIVRIAGRIQGLPRHMTQHAAGVVLADGPLSNYVALQRAGGEEIITQADMHAVEDLGLLKIDLLGLRYLTIADRTVRWVAEHEGGGGGMDDGGGITGCGGSAISEIEDIPLDDPAVFAAIGRGETIGTFQLESSGMRRLIRRMRPENLEDIMCICALFRPGPLGSGMDESFIRRRHGLEPVSYFHPILKPVLRDTYGVILYQEQVMQVAQVMAGYSLGRADILRKAIAKTDQAALEREGDHFVAGARTNGIPGGTAAKVFALIREFGSYGFAKAHAAAYARTAIRTVWLRCYYPVPYFANLLSLNYGWRERFDQYLSELHYLGIRLLLPDINRSEVLFTPEGGSIRAGLGLVRDLGEKAVAAILAERKRSDYRSFADFCSRMSGALSKKAITHLIKVGAFDCFGGTRPGKLLALQGLWDSGRKEAEAERARLMQGQLALPGAERMDWTDMTAGAQGADRRGRVCDAFVSYSPPEFSDAERLKMERELLGFYLTSHPLDSYEEAIRALGVRSAADVGELEHGDAVFLCGCVGAARGNRTRDGKRMLFATLEDKQGRADLVVFPTVLQKYGHLFAANNDRPLLVWGRIDRTEQEPTVIVRKVQEFVKAQ
ncbi:MAG TPA: DNA polymerase III subunit alpha [Firmicutes bacterium]|jgi:DNA polymerase-3 subunit alpha|nr:DNA polymerase III subunit alpha [Bacillota bacterium]